MKKGKNYEKFRKNIRNVSHPRSFCSISKKCGVDWIDWD